MTIHGTYSEVLVAKTLLSELKNSDHVLALHDMDPDRQSQPSHLPKGTRPTNCTPDQLVGIQFDSSSSLAEENPLDYANTAFQTASLV